ncbi:MAG: hypothetical protein IJP59_09465 [Muribaculaceae bacterium]|nr:hypothetical protein [Muribaculaceae bacterium]
MISAESFLAERRANQATELPSEVLFKELLRSHDGIAMKYSDLVPTEKAESLDLIDGIPLRYESEQIA